MNDMRKGWSRKAIAARVTAVALVLVLACLAPQRMEARAPVLDAAGGGGAPPAGLSAGDWAAIQARLAQAGAHPPLVTSEVAKLAAADAAPSDRFGFAVAVSGDTVVVGAFMDDDGGYASGSAYVFERNYDPGDPGTPLADNWGQVQKLTADDAEASDYFGASVAVSGDTVVVGAPEGYGGMGGALGSAYVFERNQGGPDHWGQVQKLTASDATEGDWFGLDVAISGDTVVVGAYGDEAYTGSAYLFERNYDSSSPGTPLADNWGQLRKLTADDAAYSDVFGVSVAISGDTVVVGAHLGGSDSSGAAYVFGCNQGGADNWGQVAKLTAADAGSADYFGTSVAVSGDTAVVGANQHGVGGAAYVFERNYDPGDPGTPLADNWGQVQKLTASDPAADDRFGTSVAISGDIVVVGAYGDDDAGYSTGSVYIFARNQGGADGWGQVRKLTAGDAAAGDEFGRWVTISGNTVVVGAPEDDDAGNDSGSAYVYARRGAAWVQQQKPVAGDAAADDRFGDSVAISGDAFIAGAPGGGAAYVFYRNEDGADRWGQVWDKSISPLSSVAVDVDTAVVGTTVGALGAHQRAYVFERNDSGADLWGYVRTLYGADDSGFGNSVSISGDTVVVGAPHDDVACSDCGAAYVYERNYDPGNPGTPLAENWGLRTVLTATNSAAGEDGFGWSVAISGDTVVVGALQDTHDGKSEAGSVYVFKRNYDEDHPWTPKADNWGLVCNLTASDAAAWAWFGHAVAISGDTFVVGAYGDDGGTGSAYVFERNQGGADKWGQVEKLTADDPDGGDIFGWSVGIGGDTVVVGAPYDDDAGGGSGSAYLFKRNAGGADNWGQVEKLTADDAAALDYFGDSVSISGNTVVVGAPYDDDGGGESGSTYVFRWVAAEVCLPLVLKD